MKIGWSTLGSSINITIHIMHFYGINVFLKHALFTCKQLLLSGFSVLSMASSCKHNLCNWKSGIIYSIIWHYNIIKSHFSPHNSFNESVESNGRVLFPLIEKTLICDSWKVLVITLHRQWLILFISLSLWQCLFKLLWSWSSLWNHR